MKINVSRPPSPPAPPATITLEDLSEGQVRLMYLLRGRSSGAEDREARVQNDEGFALYSALGDALEVYNII